MPIRLAVGISLLLATLLPAQSGWTELLNRKDLDGWEVVGDGAWIVLRDGTLLGQCHPRKPFEHQAWLYTKKELGEFDLQLGPERSKTGPIGLQLHNKNTIVMFRNIRLREVSAVSRLP